MVPQTMMLSTLGGQRFAADLCRQGEPPNRGRLTDEIADKGVAAPVALLLEASVKREQGEEGSWHRGCQDVGAVLHWIHTVSSVERRVPHHTAGCKPLHARKREETVVSWTSPWGQILNKTAHKNVQSARNGAALITACKL